MLATALGMSLSYVIGGYAAHSTVAMIVVAAVWGYLYGLICSLGSTAAAVGLNSVVALVIADVFAKSNLASIPYQALFVLFGGIEQTLLLVVLWPTRRYSAERHALGDAYRALGQYAGDLGTTTPAALHPGVITSVRQTLADPAPFSKRGDIATFQALLDEAERARATLAGLVTDRYRYERRNEPETVRKLAELGSAVAPLLEEIATALHEGRAPTSFGGEWQRADAAAQTLASLPGAIGKHARSQAQALLGQLRTAWRTADVPADERGGRVEPPRSRAPRLLRLSRFREALFTLRANLGFDSPFGRHALRLAAALGIAMAIARSGAVPRGYWIAMTAALVLRPDFQATFTRGFARILGTLLGAVVATVIVVAAHPSQALLTGLAVLFAALGYFVFTLNYAVYTLTVTAYVVFLLALSGSAQEHDAVLERTIATLLGAGLATFAYLIWPTWEAGRARTALADQVDAYRRNIRAILGAYVKPDTRDAQRLRELQNAAWQARVRAEHSVDTMIAEPERTHAIAASAALGVLAAAQRIGIAQLTLRSYLDEAAAVPRPVLIPLRDGLDMGLQRCVALLRGNAQAPPMPPLREIYVETEKRLAQAQDADTAVILTECDLFVDGVNTIGELLNTPRVRVPRRNERIR